MLITPLGPIKLFVNDREIDFKAMRYVPDKRCPDLNGRFFIQYEYKNEFKGQTIKCCLIPGNIEWDSEGGERFEAISFYKDFTKLTIGTEAYFGLEEEEGYDYTGDYLHNGIELVTTPTTRNRIFLFGISWIRPYTEDNEYQTWMGADPASLWI